MLWSDATEKALEIARRHDERLVVADAIFDDYLMQLCKAAKHHRLVTGGSGIAMRLPGNFGIRLRTRFSDEFAAVNGPAIIL